MASATKTFEFEVIEAGGKRSKGTIDAASEHAAVAALRARNAIPLSIAASGTGLRREINIPGLSGRVTLKDLAVFTRQFATMTSSGMSLLRCLAVLEEQTTKPKLRTAIADIRSTIEGGSSLSAALAKHDRLFPTLMIAMVRAGEAGGFLDGALERVAVNFEKDTVLRAKIKGALTYPVIVLAFSLLMIIGVLMFIVPVFERMFKQLGGSLPAPTQLLVSLSHSMAWLAPVLLVLGIAATIGYREGVRRNPAMRLMVDRIKLRVPVFGPLFKKIAVGRFARNLGTLLSVGVPVMQALSVVGETTGNAVVTEAMISLQSAVREGKPMSVPMRANALFPLMVTQMVEVGEESGAISAMLDKVADFYEREVEAAADSLTAAIEPIMVLVMGVIVGGMVVCLYLPMFSIYQHIGGATQ